MAQVENFMLIRLLILVLSCGVGVGIGIGVGGLSQLLINHHSTMHMIVVVGYTILDNCAMLSRDFS